LLNPQKKPTDGYSVAAKRFPSNCVAGAHTEELQRGPLTPLPENLPPKACREPVEQPKNELPRQT